MKKFLPILVILCLSGCFSKKKTFQNSGQTAVKTMEVVDPEGKELA